MQGVVTDGKGAYVKAAIVRLLKAKDSGDGSDAVTVTYAETDEEGRFVIQDLNPDEKYIIEIHVESPDQAMKDEAATEATAAAEPEALEKETEPGPAVAAAEEEPKPAAVEVEEEPKPVAADPEAVEKGKEPKPAAVKEVRKPKPAAKKPEPEAVKVVKKPEPEAQSEDEVLVLSSEVDIAESPYDDDDPDFGDGEEAFPEEDDITIDLAFWNKKDDLTSIQYKITENLSINSLYQAPGFNLKDKPYLIKNNLW